MPAVDDMFMDMALGLARRGLGQTAPNPTVGAVLVRAGDPPEIVARGWTQPGGRPHAETVALEAAGALADGASLYVTLEPCAHHGRTPPCADAVIASRVARVVCALEDPDPRVGGEGLARLAAAGIEVAVGCRSQEARWLNLGHILRVTGRRPFIQLKLAVGADGLMAPGRGRPVWVTGQEARANAHLLRARADAIVVGSGTVAADDPELTCRLPGMASRSPVRIILDSEARTPTQARVFRALDRAPVWIACSDTAPRERRAALRRQGARMIPAATDAAGRPSLEPLLATLAADGVTRLLVEGGPRVARAFLDRNLVDEAVFFSGASPVGPGGMLPLGADGLDLVAKSDHFIVWRERRLGLDRMTVYRRR